MVNMVTNEEALDLHKKAKGKIETAPKVTLNTGNDLATYYTPGVAFVSEAIKANKEAAYDYTWKSNTIAIVSDGTRILGLGNVGPEAGLPVMEGKALLFKKFGAVDAIPLCIGTTDEQEIIKFVKNIAPTFGAVNIEDIESPKCFDIVDSLSDSLGIPVFHDDQHGTSVVITAGLINALKLAGKTIKNINIVINGAGAAGLGEVRMLNYMGVKNITVLDKAGIIYEGRPENMNKYKDEIAKATNTSRKSGTLEDAVKNADVLIGVSSAGSFNKNLISLMGDKPIVFALANPVPEISYEDAKAAGAFVAATGQSGKPNQVNNVLSFPAIMRGILDARVIKIKYDLLYYAAKALSQAAGKNLTVEHILPDPTNRKEMRRVVENVAIAIGEAALKSNNTMVKEIDPSAMRRSISERLARYSKLEKRLSKLLIK